MTKTDPEGRFAYALRYVVLRLCDSGSDASYRTKIALTINNIKIITF